jgi:hypothetical protein
MDVRRTQFPLRLYATFLIALSDWLVFAVNLAVPPSQFWSVNLTGAGLAMFTVWLLEGENGEGATLPRATKALSAGLIVAAPFPILGTLTAAGALTWSLAQSVLQRKAH